MTRQVQSFHEFGAYRIDSARRLLLRDGEVVPLTPKCFEILIALVENRGEVISKEDLMNRVWPDSFVEEGNLTYTISVLRKALGEHAGQHQYIVTAPGRGYQFVTPVSEAQEEAACQATSNDPRKRTGWERNAILFSVCLLLIGLVVALSYFFISSRAKPKDMDAATTGAFSSDQPSAQVRSIAVLPFKPLSADGSDEYLGLGMADTLIIKLSGISSIIVRPIGTVSKYKGLEQDPLAAGRELRVGAVLDSSIQKVGERIRVTTRLIRVADGTSLWAYKFDEHSADLFAMQDSISEQVASSLTPKLTGEEKQRLAKHYTENNEAYQLYVKGRFHWNKTTEEGARKSIEYFQQALAKDPNYALAYFGLSDAYQILGQLGVRPNEVYPKALVYAEKALAVDPTLPEAHFTRGAYELWYGWNWTVAEQELKRAFEPNTNVGGSHDLYGQLLAGKGRFDEAIAENKRALEFYPLFALTNSNLGLVYYYARQYDQAIEQCRKTLELDPNFFFTTLYIGWAYGQQGKYQEAIAELTKARNLPGGFAPASSELGYVYAVSGRREEAQEMLKELQKRASREFIDPYYIAIIYVGLGEQEQALAWLNKACEERSFWLLWLNVEPKFDRLRSDPRFGDLRQRVGI
jgi:DNA-binding winged helix-turn-helix (wHTH) protein/TolB-like protein/Flp pilus assembly protein TadD